MGFDVQTAKNPLASTLTHARAARTTLYAHNMHARHGYDVKLHPHRMLALMTSLLMGRKATTKQTNNKQLKLNLTDISTKMFEFEVQMQTVS